MVLLTWNEEHNIAACLRSIAEQTARDFEVILIDAASTDRTVEVARAEAATMRLPVAIHVAKTKIPIGDARNLGVRIAQAPMIAFLSADAELDRHWIQRAFVGLEKADMVYGRQVHAPPRWTVGACVRGLRYHFPTEEVADPLPYASNVAAAYRRAVLHAFPFDAWANAAEDLLIAKRARAAGFHLRYDPQLVVRHHDVATARQEWRKNVREGEGWGLYRAELGYFPMVLAWGFLLILAISVASVYPNLVMLLLIPFILLLPALRRAWRRRSDMPVGALALGVVTTPPFDLAFLVNYVRGLLARAPEQNVQGKPKETQG